MTFTIRHYRNGHLLTVTDQAMTMYGARCAARNRQEEIQSNQAVIVAERANGETMEIEVMEFAD